MYFTPDKAPAGAGTRCLIDCKIESTCPFSAYKNYIEQDLWGSYVWDSVESVSLGPSLEQKIQSLQKDNPYGRCVWRCDNEVVDHQTVDIEFEDGSIATHSMNGNSAKPCRYIHIIGTTGEIEGVMEEGYFIIRRPDARKGHEYSEAKVNVNVVNDMHGGGDLHLVADFVNVVCGKPPSISTTSLEDSINGHLIGFAANEANEERKVILI